MTGDSCQKERKHSYLKVLLIEIYPDTQNGLLKKKIRQKPRNQFMELVIHSLHFTSQRKVVRNASDSVFLENKMFRLKIRE